MMKILIASDSFKESLSSVEVGAALKTGLLKSQPGADIEAVPLADGGEGTVEAIVSATGGNKICIPAHDPLMRIINACYGISGDSLLAIIEMAATSGLSLLKESERNPWITTTYGVGEIIGDAIKRGCKTLVLGLGGSATNDAGTGMAIALGVEIRDKNNNAVGYGGGLLSNIEEINLFNLRKKLKDVKVIAACDVNNPLTGKNGASYVYAAQKGANAEMIENLEKNMDHFSQLLKNTMDIDFSSIPGAGAAGGLGAGLMAFLNARLEPGFKVISNIVGLENKISNADLIITGEGKIDYQTRFGKTPYGVAMLAKKYNKKVVAIAGALGEKWESLSDVFDLIIKITDEKTSKDESIKNASYYCEKTGELIGNTDLFKNFSS